MTVSLKHAHVATGTDAGNGEVHKAEWNAEHTLTMATARLLGRTTASAGAVEEISAGNLLVLSGGVLSVDSEFEASVSLIALKVADLNNAALGFANRWADSFDATTYVDVAGATNLSTATAGVLAPSSAASAISGATGTNIGNATAGGGLAAAFDGSAGVSVSGSAQRTNADNAFVGKDYTSTKTITKVDVYPSTDAGFFEQRTSLTIEIRGHSSAPSAGTEGTLLATSGSIADTTTMQTLTIASPQAFRYVWAYIVGTGGSLGHAWISELTFYEGSGLNNVTVSSSSIDFGFVPVDLRVLARLEKTGTVTLNTDVTFEVSRNGGTTWTSAPISQIVAESSSFIVVQSDWISVTAQSSAQNARWRWKTLNNKDVKLHDAYLMARD